VAFLGDVILVTQFASIAFILWPVFRIARKAGYGKGQSWGLILWSSMFSIIGMGLYFLAVSNKWLFNLGGETTTDILWVFFANFVYSPFTLCIVPLIYFSFKSPRDAKNKEADVFG
jgi:hypothetical protein